MRLTAEKDRLEQELALLREEIRIKDARMTRLAAHRRPQYTPVERMAILELKAARAWSLTQAAEAFLVTAETIASWTKRVDEAGRTPSSRSPSRSTSSRTSSARSSSG
jgi:hypothetical protein